MPGSGEMTILILSQSLLIDRSVVSNNSVTWTARGSCYRFFIVFQGNRQIKGKKCSMKGVFPSQQMKQQTVLFQKVLSGNEVEQERFVLPFQ